MARAHGLTSILVGLLCLVVGLSSCGLVGDERVAGTTEQIGGSETFLVASGPAASTLPRVLFLHGASYNADVWVNTGIVDSLTDAGIGSVALDLPGFGQSGDSDLTRPDFLAAAIDAVDDGRGVVVVSPSMSGSFSLPLLSRGAPGALVGFVAIAPVGIADFVATTDVVNVPLVVFWGEGDTVIPVSQAQELVEAFPVSRVEMVAGAGHAAYEDQPELFAASLIAFVNELGS